MGKITESEEEFLLTLYEKYYGYMKRQILKIVADEETTKDLVQDSILRLLKQVGTLFQLSEAQLVVYLTKTAKSVAIGYMQKKNVRAKWTYYGEWQDVSDEFTDTSTPQSIYEQRCSHQELKTALSKLSERDQDLLDYYYILGIDSKELSRIMNIPLRNLRQAIYMARKRARFWMGGAIDE